MSRSLDARETGKKSHFIEKQDLAREREGLQKTRTINQLQKRTIKTNLSNEKKNDPGLYVGAQTWVAEGLKIYLSTGPKLRRRYVTPKKLDQDRQEEKN